MLRHFHSLKHPTDPSVSRQRQEPLALQDCLGGGLFGEVYVTQRAFDVLLCKAAGDHSLVHLGCHSLVRCSWHSLMETQNDIEIDVDVFMFRLSLQPYCRCSMARRKAVGDAVYTMTAKGSMSGQMETYRYGCRYKHGCTSKRMACMPVSV